MSHVSFHRAPSERRRGVRPARRAQRGLGLLEVLIALVVVSFGVLGMAGLQLTGMKHSAGGFNRAKAVLLAENMATRMRINTPNGVLAAGYDGFDSAAAPTLCEARPMPYCQTSAAGAAGTCDAAELAAFDTFSVACGDWGDGAAGSPIARALPAGKLRVLCDDLPCRDDSIRTIEVEWEEGSTTSTDPEKVDTRIVSVRLRP